MPLSEDDVREILRLIDESDVAELLIETDELSLHVVRDQGSPGMSDPVEDEPVAAPAAAEHTIAAPMLGTFYRAPAPGAPPFVDVGARVEPDTVVCLIEVMKMMNPVSAGVTGTIVEACVENASPVEYDAPLFQVRVEG